LGGFCFGVQSFFQGWFDTANDFFAWREGRAQLISWQDVSARETASLPGGYFNTYYSK